MCSFWIQFCKNFLNLNPHNVWGWRMHERFTEPGGCKNVSYISLSFTCNTHESHNFLSYSQVENPLISSTWKSSSCKFNTCLMLNTSASENTSVWTWILKARMTQCTFYAPGSVQAFLNIPSNIILSLLCSFTVKER
jgi:hypothetical protein